MITTKMKTAVQKYLQHPLLRSIFSVALISFGAKLVMMLKELFVAGYYGTNDDLDAFLVAFVIPMFVINIITGSFYGALIPTYLKVKEHEGEQLAKRLLVTFLNVNLLGLLIISILLYICGPITLELLYPGFPDEKMLLTKNLFLGLVPIVFVSGICACFSVILNANERYKVFSIVPVTTPVITIFFIFWQGTNIYGLVWASVIGIIIETLILIGYSLKLKLLAPIRWYGIDQSIKEVGSQYLPMFIGSILLGNMMLVDQTMAASLGAGSVSTLNYGGKVISFVLGVFSLALSTVLFPHLSKLAAKQNWILVKAVTKKYLLYVLSFSILIMLLLILTSEWITSLLFERGAFTSSDTADVSFVHLCYSIQIPFYMAGIIGSRMLSALKSNKRMMWINIGSLFFNIILNYVFMGPFGVAGIALATSFVYFISMILMFINVFAILNKNISYEKGLLK